MRKRVELGLSKMPIIVKDFVWRETETEVLITVPLKGVKSHKVDIFSTDEYIKVNFPPFLYEVQLFAPVVEEQCEAKVGNGTVEFRLVKKTVGLWGSLNNPDARSKEAMKENREKAIARAHERAELDSKDRAKKKREEEQYAIKEQMRIEQEEQERIEKEKQEERDKATRDLEEWKERKKRTEIKRQPKPTTLKPTNKYSSDIWTQDDDSAPPPPRKGGSISVHFTPRTFPTAARESKHEEEQEWLAKMAAARKIKPPENPDETINERNPEFLKDKGIEFFKAGNFQAAISVFTEAIKLNNHLPYLYSNRAACYLRIGNDGQCIEDCCQALDLLYPITPSNYSARTKAFVRRGAAYGNIGSLDLALQDYEEARKLSPQDERIQKDCVRIRQALLAEV